MLAFLVFRVPFYSVTPKFWYSLLMVSLSDLVDWIKPHFIPELIISFITNITYFIILFFIGFLVERFFRNAPLNKTPITKIM
jgi:hypothetical protein